MGAFEIFVQRQATRLRMRLCSIGRSFVVHIVKAYNESIIPVQEIIANRHSDSAHNQSLVMGWREGNKKQTMRFKHIQIGAIQDDQNLRAVR